MSEDKNSMADAINLNEEEVTVTLSLDDGRELECIALGIFEAGGREYIALLPAEETEDEDEGDVYLYRYSETEDGEPQLDNIESDEEYEIASEAFDEMLDGMEFDELVGEDEVED